MVTCSLSLENFFFPPSPGQLQSQPGKKQVKCWSSAAPVLRPLCNQVQAHTAYRRAANELNDKVLGKGKQLYSKNQRAEKLVDKHPKEPS